MATGGGAAAPEDAAACNCCPIARADALKFENEFGALVFVGQLIANTIPAPQCDAGVFAACLHYRRDVSKHSNVFKTRPT